MSSHIIKRAMNKGALKEMPTMWIRPWAVKKIL